MQYKFYTKNSNLFFNDKLITAFSIYNNALKIYTSYHYNIPCYKGDEVYKNNKLIFKF